VGDQLCALNCVLPHGAAYTYSAGGADRSYKSPFDAGRWNAWLLTRQNADGPGRRKDRRGRAARPLPQALQTGRTGHRWRAGCASGGRQTCLLVPCRGRGLTPRPDAALIPPALLRSHTACRPPRTCLRPPHLCRARYLLPPPTFPLSARDARHTSWDTLHYLPHALTYSCSCAGATGVCAAGAGRATRAADGGRARQTCHAGSGQTGGGQAAWAYIALLLPRAEGLSLSLTRQAGGWDEWAPPPPPFPPCPPRHYHTRSMTAASHAHPPTRPLYRSCGCVCHSLVAPCVTGAVPSQAVRLHSAFHVRSPPCLLPFPTV